MKCLKVWPQYIVPQRGLTKLAGWFGNCRWVWLKNHLIRYFINKYNVDLKAAALTTIDDYPTFNSFFTRALKPELRPIPNSQTAIISPADGCISQLGLIDNESLFQAKGFTFDLVSLLGGSKERAQLFCHGNFATIYLAPKDYHRVHMPFAGKLRETIFIPGKLFSVNQKTACSVPKLFARNERLVCIFDTRMGPMAVILVGAMLVGSIETKWGTAATNQITVQSFPDTGDKSIHLAMGEELGQFKMGSTVILLFPKDIMTWEKGISENSPLKMGELLGEINAS